LRASGVRAAIIAVVEGAAVDATAGSRDKFIHVDTGGRELETAPDRVFRATLTQPPRRTPYLTMDAYTVEYTVDVYYTPSKMVEDRIASDAEQITYDLATLQQQDSGIMVSDVQIGSVIETDNLIVARIPVLVTYRLTGVS
tara:strand:- start:1486 stop:1908 length:423 start_codon:yes stop_codon:yes gene_type:complete